MVSPQRQPIKIDWERWEGEGNERTSRKGQCREIGEELANSSSQRLENWPYDGRCRTIVWRLQQGQALRETR